MARPCTLIGPISGRPDGNQVAFRNAAIGLGIEGWQPFNPRQHELSEEAFAEAQRLGDEYQSGELYKQLMRACLEALLVSEAAWVLSGWETSAGARFEVRVALMIGVEVWTWNTAPLSRVPVRKPALEPLPRVQMPPEPLAEQRYDPLD